MTRSKPLRGVRRLRGTHSKQSSTDVLSAHCQRNWSLNHLTHLLVGSRAENRICRAIVIPKCERTALARESAFPRKTAKPRSESAARVEQAKSEWAEMMEAGTRSASRAMI